jgi:MFS family permease
MSSSMVMHRLSPRRNVSYVYRDLARLPAAIWVVAAGSLIDRFGSFVLPFLVLYLRHHGFGAAQAGLAVAFYGGGKILSAPSGGFLADRLGPRNAIACSMLASAATMLTLWRVTGAGATAIYGATFATGWASEAYRPSVSALVASTVEAGPRQVTAFALYQLGANLGLALGPVVGGIVAAYSFTPLFVGDAATSLIFAAISLVALPAGADRAGAVTVSSTSALRTILADRVFLRFWAAVLLVNVVLFQAQTTFPLWVTGNGHSATVYGALLGLNAAVIACFQLPLTSYTSRVPAWQVIGFSSLLAGSGFGILALGGSAPLLIVSVLVWSGSELVGWPVARAWVTEHAPAGLVGRYAGAQSLAFGLAFMLAPLAGTALYAVSPRLLWLTCFTGGLLGAALLSSKSRSAVARRRLGSNQPGTMSPAAHAHKRPHLPTRNTTMPAPPGGAL